MYLKLIYSVLIFGVLLNLTDRLYAQDLFRITSLEFNTKEYDETAPVVYNEGLVIVTHRMQYVYKIQVDQNENPINDLYYVKRLKDGQWGNLEMLTGEVNSKYHEGKCTFSKDGNTIFFTRFQNDSAGYIYKAYRAGSDWGNLSLISINSDKYQIKDPCLSADGKKLFFASNAPGGYGGWDLYVTVFEKGDWSIPKNLGSLINTKGNEVAPFYHANGKLYFSSNKLPGIGRYDIFYSRECKGEWLEPKHLPGSINSNRDDLYYYSDAADTSGYFSSNRNRSFDVFSFNTLWPKFDSCQAIKVNNYTYNFHEKGTVDNDTTTWLYEWDFGDSTKLRGKKADADHKFPAVGQYTIQLNIIDTLTNELVLNEDAYIFDVTDEEQAIITCPDSSVLGNKIKFDASSSNLPSFKKLDMFFWDFGDGVLDTGISPEHVYCEPGVYKVKLLVKSVPDDQGKVMQNCVFKEIIVTP